MLMMIMALAAAAGQTSMPAQQPQGQGQWGHGGPGGGHGGRGGPGGPGGPGGGADRFFAMADTDHNGQISKAEFEAARARMREHRMERRDMRQGGGNGFGPMQQKPQK